MSKATPHTVPLGDVTITIINVGDMMVDMAQSIEFRANSRSTPRSSSLDL